MTGKHASLAERLWARINVRGPDECWPWTGATARRGWRYGKIGAGGECGATLLAHRVCWAVCFGPIPDGLFVLHHCDNPPCCNPRHLFLGTDADNMADMKAVERESALEVRMVVPN